ncbi:hypothetical protein [Gymnodinialimonas hymeniacidonis]|uniref:hypothetical protein n=1 Tax=Gymnodinialimonas hymeniacidonis TaxID=3126508 RepID=UPI0034C606AB
MTETDKDIETLNMLFGDARADYQSLRHGAVPPPLTVAPQAKPRPARRFLAIAAGVAALGVTGLVLLSLNQPDNSTGPRLIAAPQTMPDAPTGRPQFNGSTRPNLSFSRMTLDFTLPQRPDGSNG